MKCPVCTDATLLMAERQGIEIDYCPQCRGVWLCRGELDKIIERSQRDPVSAPPQTSAPDPRQRHGCDDDEYRFGRSGHQTGRRGFFKDLFD